MTFMKRRYLIVMLLLSVALSSCKKYFDINTDPSTPQNPSSKSMVAPLFAQMERGVQYDSRYLGGIIQYFGGNVNVGESHGYIAASDAAGEIWRSNYFGLGSNLNYIIDKSGTEQEWNFVGLSQAIQAWSWQLTTDYHGEIILKQAFEPNRYIFDYDSQEDVYAEVVRLAKLSIENFSRTDGNGTQAKLATSDLVYGGDNQKWIKFCYGLLARNANNLINKSTYNPQTVIDYVDKALASNADNFLIPNEGTTSTNGNFYGPLRANLGAYRQTRLIVALLDGTVFTGQPGVIDPRRNNMIVPSADGVFRGTIPGASDPGTAGNKDQIPNPWGTLGSVNPGAGKGRYLFMDKAAFPIMTYSEMQFIKAEAAFRMGNTGLAYDAYIKGISASIDFVSGLGTAISATDKAAYLASSSVKTSGNLQLSDIMFQKYLALYGYGFVETWSDLRKYHYNQGDAIGNNPYQTFFVFPSLFFADNGGKPAQRFRPRYNSEYVWNLESLKKIGGDQPDYHTKKVWFTEP